MIIVHVIIHTKRRDANARKLISIIGKAAIIYRFNCKIVKEAVIVLLKDFCKFGKNLNESGQ